MRYLVILALLFMSACGPDTEVDDGEKIVYFPGTDQVMQRIHYKNGKKNGSFKEFFRNGQLKARQVFVNDSLDDTTMIYHPSGHLKTIHVYKNKKANGCWREYNKEGKMYSEIFFKEGNLDSVCTEYSYRSLELQARIHYKKGVKHGLEEKYHSSGRIKSKVYYNNGQAEKSAEEWYQDGQPVNNTFKIYVNENDAVLLGGSLIYKIRLEDPRPDDRVYRLVRGVDNAVVYRFPLTKEKDSYICKFDVPKGGFVMEEVEIVAYRKTKMGNTVIGKQRFNAASNNF